MQQDEEGEDPKERETQLSSDILEAKKLALQEKKNNNIPGAKQHLVHAKQLQEELDLLYKMYPQLKQQQNQ